MEEKYGKKIGTAKVLTIAVSGIIMLDVLILIGGAGALGGGISNSNSTAIAAGVVLLVVGILLLLYVIKTLQGNVTCYENAIVIQDKFKTTVIPRDQIAAIYWQRPGASASNDRMRTNATIAEITLVGGHKQYKVSDGYYSNVDVIGKYQDMYKIPQEIKR